MSGRETSLTSVILKGVGWFGLGSLALGVLLSDFLAHAPAGTAMAGAELSPPSDAHPFGTDLIGRDMFSETLHGLAVTGVDAALAALIAILFGGLFGSVAARLPRPIALIIRGFWGVLAAVPALLLAILMIGLFGHGFIIIAAGLATAPRAFVRNFDAIDPKARHSEYARATGIPGIILLKRDLTYDFRQMYGTVAARALAAVTILISTASFLGFGATAPARDLGLMIAAAKVSLFTAWWTAAFPALALVAMILFARLAAGLDEGERA